MRKMTFALVITLAAGCSTVKSGLSALGGGKPHQVTVVNNISLVDPGSRSTAPPSPPTPTMGLASPGSAPQIVVIQQAAPVAELAMLPDVEPTPLAKLPAPKKSRVAALKAVASGAVAGALVGTAVGYAVGGSNGAAKGAALGAGAGAVGGAAAHQAR